MKKSQLKKLIKEGIFGYNSNSHSTPSDKEIMDKFKKQFKKASKNDHDIEFAQEEIVQKFNIMYPHMDDQIQDYLEQNKQKYLNEDFNPNIAPGSTYAIEIKKLGRTGAVLTQDNGQEVVVHYEDIPDVIKELKKIYN